jgi:AcrR family transcriptional regulator
MEEDTPISLRERKYAQTKLALLHAAIEKMREKPLEAISVKELCDTVPVSEMTFYNYFPKKTDLLKYFIQITFIEMAWYLQYAVKNKTNLEMVEELVDFLARKVVGNSFIMTETLIHFGQERKKPEFEQISKAEQLLAFPDLPGIEEVHVKDTRLETMVEPYLRQAIEQGELPKNLDLNTVVLMTVSNFIGLVINLHLTEPELVRPLCRRQLHLLWKALRAEAEEKYADTTTN